MFKYKVAVLGAGINGLSSAVQIQEARPDCHLTLISEVFSPHTTSDGCGGLWLPYFILLDDADADIIAETGKMTYDYLKQLCTSELAGEIGAQIVTTFYLEEEAGEIDNPVRNFVDGYRQLNSKEMQRFNKVGRGFCFDSITIDVPPYLTRLFKQFKDNGGRVRCQRINNILELFGQFDAVVNCCGVGAANLFNDPLLVPVRGQILRMDAPWIKQCYVYKPQNEKNYYYLIPGSRLLVVGGTADSGDWSTVVREEDEKAILQKVNQLFPQMKHARKIRSWAGLRPARTPLRLESEKLRIGNQTLSVIHNYGHGGSGVSLHWGCAHKVVMMLKELLPSQQRSPSVQNDIKSKM